jgi:hypothetical protein
MKWSIVKKPQCIIEMREARITCSSLAVTILPELKKDFLLRIPVPGMV